MHIQDNFYSQLSKNYIEMREAFDRHWKGVYR